MTDRDPALGDALRRAFPATATADWSDVLGRAEAAPEPRASRRRFLVPAAVAGALLAIVTLALVSPWEGDGGNPILERALAAVGDGPVLHFVVRERVTEGQRYEVESGRSVAVESVTESWVDEERGRAHAIERRDGEVMRDELIELGGFGPAETKAALAADYRRRLQQGEWRVVRTGTIGGRKVHWLASNTTRPGIPTTEAAVDAETYELVRIQTVGGHFRSTVDYVLLGSVARDKADFTVRFAPPRVARETRPEGERVGPAAAARAVDGAQWAGPRVSGLPLRELRASRWSATLRNGDELRGVILTVAYGERLGTILKPSTGSPTGVEVTQAADDAPARRFLVVLGGAAPPPPEGTFDLSAESTPSGDSWVATLRKPGVWIRVRASSRELLFETVRSLRPIS